MPEQVSLTLPSQLCPFCHERDVALLCDERLEGGGTCDKPMCMACTKNIGRVHIRLSRRDKQGRRCLTDTLDQCPDFQAKHGLEAMNA